MKTKSTPDFEEMFPEPDITLGSTPGRLVNLLKTKSTEEWVDKLKQRSDILKVPSDIDELCYWLEYALTQHTNDKLRELLDGVVMGSDGERECYFIPVERFDLLQAEIDKQP